MYEVIGIERIDRVNNYTRNVVKGYTIHTLDYSVELNEGTAVKKFYFPDPADGRPNKAANLKIGYQITEVYYNADKFPISYDLADIN